MGLIKSLQPALTHQTLCLVGRSISQCYAYRKSGFLHYYSHRPNNNRFNFERQWFDFYLTFIISSLLSLAFSFSSASYGSTGHYALYCGLSYFAMKNLRNRNVTILQFLSQETSIRDLSKFKIRRAPLTYRSEANDSVQATLLAKGYDYRA